MPLALTGSLTAVQFYYSAELPLTLNKLKRFETGSDDYRQNVFLMSFFLCHIFFGLLNDFDKACDLWFRPGIRNPVNHILGQIGP